MCVRKVAFLLLLFCCLPSFAQEAWLQPGATILANPMGLPDSHYPAQVIRYNADSETYLIRFLSGPYAVGKGEYTLSASKLRPAPTPAAQPAQPAQPAVAAPAQPTAAVPAAPAPAPAATQATAGSWLDPGRQVMVNVMNFPDDFHPAQILGYNPDSDTYRVKVTSGPYARGNGEYTLSRSRLRPNGDATATQPAPAAQTAQTPPTQTAQTPPAAAAKPAQPTPAAEQAKPGESTWEQMWREREQTIAAQKNPQPAGKVAGATPFQGVYLRHEQSAQGFREDHYYFFPDGRVYHEVPPEGPSRFNWEQAQRETPQLCGYYGVNGQEITFSWPGGGYTWILKPNGGGYEMNYSPTVKVDKFPANARLSGTYARGDITAAVGQPTLSTAWTYTFSPDGTVIMNDMKGADTANVTATVTERDRGTYTLSGNDLEIRSAAGVWRCTAYPQPNGTPSQTPARISIDGSLLERR